MHHYFRNHQLYLAKKCRWLDRDVNKESKRALMKIESLHIISEKEEDQNKKKSVFDLVKENLLNNVSNKQVLRREGFYVSNLDN